ncbi:hypothetical protein SAMN05518801_1231 [Novosphingobium sp. CF614]|uniref:hypothetical protein n=1 Tax=Novosphingobium sp. CF614 TaxID=1884364 RepID=UPI0008F4246A|nr:hypothetical protein [Novosphingobium sp. CF614]SFG40466.1 hypothetical protein SAMN05518801_1231 [Novosphingobium sp. CF614]
MEILSKAARNLQIETAYMSGASVKTLATEFGLSQTRVRQILVNLERSRRTIRRRLEAPLRRAR